MKHVTILPDVHLHDVTIFDIGNNPDHVNDGLMNHNLTEWLTSSLGQLQDADYLSVSGYVLDSLYEEAPELLDTMTSLVNKNGILLTAMPYYTTKLNLLSEKTFTSELEKHEKALKKHFGRGSDAFFAGKQGIPKHLSSAIGSLVMPVLGNSSLDFATASLGSETSFVSEQSVIGPHSALQLEHYTEMQQHVMDELLAMKPFIGTDARLSQSWHMLGSMHAIDCIHEDCGNGYEGYINSMNILNDMAHTIKTVELAKQGKFATKPEIVEQPSKLIKEVLP